MNVVPRSSDVRNDVFFEDDATRNPKIPGRDPQSQVEAPAIPAEFLEVSFSITQRKTSGTTDVFVRE
jgi:hypothetical protein